MFNFSIFLQDPKKLFHYDVVSAMRISPYLPINKLKAIVLGQKKKIVMLPSPDRP